MNNTYNLIVGIDISKGKADAAVYKVFDSRSKKSTFVLKRTSFSFCKSATNSFMERVRSYADSYCNHIRFAMEVTGIYSDNLYYHILDNLKDNEDVKYLDTQYVNEWRESHKIAKSDPLDARTIAEMTGTDEKVRFVSPLVYGNKKGYKDLKIVVHRYDQLKKIISQESNRLLSHTDCCFPELQYVFDTNSATYLAILSKYPTTYDIINASQDEVFNVAYEASKHRTSRDKIVRLFELCNDTLTSKDETGIESTIVTEMIENIRYLKSQLKACEKLMNELACQYEVYKLLLTMIGCGPLTAATVVAEIGDISRFKNADALVCYAGAAPINKRSGSSVETMGKISKKGSKYLRHAIFMIAEFARRHNPVLKKVFDRVKNGNKKFHKKAVVAVANKVARYIYSIMKNGSTFVISHEDIMHLNEETRNTFFSSILLDFPKKTRRQIYQYCDEYGEVHRFVFTKKIDSPA